MDDLNKRLRQAADDFPLIDPTNGHPKELFIQAADRIEELEAAWHQHIQVSVNNAFTIVSLEKKCDELNVALCEAVQVKATQVADARAEAYQMILDFDNKLRELSEWWAENTEPQSEAWDLSQAIIKTLDGMNR